MNPTQLTGKTVRITEFLTKDIECCCDEGMLAVVESTEVENVEPDGSRVIKVKLNFAGDNLEFNKTKMSNSFYDRTGTPNTSWVDSTWWNNGIDELFIMHSPRGGDWSDAYWNKLFEEVEPIETFTIAFWNKSHAEKTIFEDGDKIAYSSIQHVITELLSKGFQAMVAQRDSGIFMYVDNGNFKQR